MKRFFKSFMHALAGIWMAARQSNMKIQLAVAAGVMAAGFYFNIAASEWQAVVLAIALVISMEILNTAIEYFVDLVSPQHQPLAGKVKDIAAGAVLVAAIAAVVIGVMIFWKYVFD
jgi:diacylglycerol kinase